MSEHFFVNRNWVSDGCFAMAISGKVDLETLPLIQLVERVSTSLLIDVVPAGDTTFKYDGVDCLAFEGYDFKIICQKKYLDMITNGFYEGYDFRYAPAEKMICIFDEDNDLVGLVMRMKNEGEE